MNPETKNETLYDWCIAAYPEIKSYFCNSGFYLKDYFEFSCLYRVAHKLDVMIGNNNLSKAGFLHVLPWDKVRDSNIERNRDIINILKHFNKFTNFYTHNKDSIKDKIRNDVYPSLKDISPIILLIITSLDYLDPDEIFTNWTYRFYKSPSYFKRKMRLIKCSQLRDKLHFTKNVVINTAKDWGFWYEHNVLENLIFYYSNRELFLRAVDFVMSCKRNKKCKSRVDIVKHALKGTDKEDYLWEIKSKELKIQWEWRHLSSIAEVLDLRKSIFNLELYIGRCGYVTVQCPDEQTCYNVLGLLHKKYYHNENRFKDHMGQNLYSNNMDGMFVNYRAIHTVLSYNNFYIPVHIIHRKAKRDGFSINKPLNLKKIINYVNYPRRALTVFTPCGQMVSLTHGSTVLNFARQIHTDLVIFTQYAIINGEKKVDIHYPLNNGDEVELILGNKPNPLSEVLRNTFRPHVIVKIRSAYNKIIKWYQK